MIVNPNAGTVTYTMAELAQVRELLSTAAWRLHDAQSTMTGLDVVVEQILPAFQVLGMHRADRKSPP